VPLALVLPKVLVVPVMTQSARSHDAGPQAIDFK
jgi:hypothetical protein